MNLIKNPVISTVIGLAALGGFIWWAASAGWPEKEPAPRPDSSAGQASLTADETAFDFGSISMSAGKVNRVFEARNGGGTAATITKIYTSCMCTEATLIRPDGARRGPYGMPGHGGFAPTLRETIAAGESFQVEVVFDPTAHGPAGIGPVERSVYLEYGNGAPLELRIAATVTP